MIATLLSAHELPVPILKGDLAIEVAASRAADGLRITDPFLSANLVRAHRCVCVVQCDIPFRLG